MNDPLPIEHQSPERFADWVETKCVCGGTGRVALEELVTGLTTMGEDYPAEASSEPTTDAAQRSLAERTWGVLENRDVCAGQGYPFSVSSEELVLESAEPEQSLYVFCLLLAAERHEAKAAEMFEFLTLAAVERYLGEGGRAVRIGTPRRRPVPSKFLDAITYMCNEMGEGIVCDPKQVASTPGDGGIDIFGWKNFPDRRPGKLMVAAGCASGQDWKDKLSDVNWESFSHFFSSRPLTIPLRIFAFPYTIDNSKKWHTKSRRGGILFDRCRLSALLGECRISDVHEPAARWASAKLI